MEKKRVRWWGWCFLVIGIVLLAGAIYHIYFGESPEPDYLYFMFYFEAKRFIKLLPGIIFLIIGVSEIPNFYGNSTLKSFFILDVMAFAALILGWFCVSVGSRFGDSIIIIGLGVFVVLIAYYVLNKNRSQSNFKREIAQTYGTEIFQSHLRYATIKTYTNLLSGNVWLYLTQWFLYEKDVIVVDYQKIVMMKVRSEYRTIHTNGHARKYLVYLLCLEMINGEEITIVNAYGLSKEVAEEIMSICLQRNPKILTNWTQKEWDDYQANAALYRQGIKVVPKLTLNQLYTDIFTNSSDPNTDTGAYQQSQVNFQIPYQNKRKKDKSYWTIMSCLCWLSIGIATFLFVSFLLTMILLRDKFTIFEMLPGILVYVFLIAALIIIGICGMKKVMREQKQLTNIGYNLNRKHTID